MKIVSENQFSGKTYFYAIASRRVAKAYARAPVLTVNGSDDGFDGFRDDKKLFVNNMIGEWGNTMWGIPSFTMFGQVFFGRMLQLLC